MGKAFEKQTKIIEKIEEEEKKAYKSKMFYEGSNKTYEFRKFKIIRVFVNEIRNNIINMSMANDEQNQLSKHIRKFKSKKRSPTSKSKISKRRCIK